MVRKIVAPELPVEVTPTDDIRSYHVSSNKIREELGFKARYAIEEAVADGCEGTGSPN